VSGLKTSAKTTRPGTSSKAEDSDWALGRAFGLKQDGGWVDELKQQWEASSANERKHWEKLIELCRQVKPRGGTNWPDVENEALCKCEPPFEREPGDEALVGADGKPLFEIPPDPGTDAYHQAVDRVAPDEGWFRNVWELIKEADEKKFVRNLTQIYRRAVQSGIGSLNRTGPNKEILRALIWSAAATPEPEIIDSLRQLALHSLDHNTAQAKTIGLALMFMGSEAAGGALRMISVSSRKPGRKARYARYASHVEKRQGIDPQSAAERFVPTFDLDTSGRRKADFGERGTVELRIEEAKSALHYFDSSGKEIAAASSAMKRHHSPALAEIRAVAKDVNKLLGNHRDRIESMFLATGSRDFADWQKCYLEHPIVGTLTRRLIWLVDQTPVLFDTGQATDVCGEKITIQPTAKISLWHPLGHDAKVVFAWRTRIELLGITQPFKQAHRELYLLTDAERRTGTYSNRFAGHILRQGQFRVLAGSRGWHAPFLGPWDSGDTGVAHRALRDGWKVEFWVNASGAEDLSPQGGLLCVATDQVRFYRNATEPSRLADVPALVFSEAMREVDFFVGVASVGNDPNWEDGGPEGRYRNYWRSYSFGDLDGSAKTRHEVLERLIPKLKIAGRCSLEDKFLTVKGSLRTYKIHLGSGNILMQPNDQYLCIVSKPGGSEADKLRLPFEGDRMLTLILSKAFLLADDTKIKDQSIVNQIRQK